jgi:hypothetical protein
LVLRASLETNATTQRRSKRWIAIASEGAKGMERGEFWLLDTNSVEFKTEARRQSRLIALSPHESDDQAFVDSISDSGSGEEPQLRPS